MKLVIEEYGFCYEGPSLSYVGYTDDLQLAEAWKENLLADYEQYQKLSEFFSEWSESEEEYAKAIAGLGLKDTQRYELDYYRVYIRDVPRLRSVE
jgi:hypothetical protein